MQKLLLLLVLLGSNALIAQVIPYHQFTTRDGIAHSTIFRIKQDSKGYVWICTNNGLSRFDGFSMKNFYTEDIAGTNYILDADTLPGNRLLVNVYKGGLCFLKDDLLKKAPVSVPAALGFLDIQKTLFSLQYDAKNSCVWGIHSSRILIQLFVRGDSIAASLADSLLRYYWVYTDPRQQRTYFATNNGLYEYTSQGMKNIVAALAGKTLYSIREIQPGTLMIGLQDGICIYNTTNQSLKMLRLKGERLQYRDFMYDSASRRIWIPSAPGGIYIFSEDDTGKPLFYVLPQANANHLFCDAANNIWCGTYGQGLYVFPPTPIVNYGINEGLTDAYVTDISRGRNNKLYISSLKYFYEFDGRFRKFDNIFEISTNQPNNRCIVFPSGERFFITGNAISNIDNPPRRSDKMNVVFDLAEHNGDTLIAGCFQGAVMLTRSGLKWLKSLRSLDRLRVHAIRKAPDGSTWFGTSGGVFRWHKENWTQFTVAQGMGNSYTYDIFITPGGAVYCGTASGLSVIYPGNTIQRPGNQELVEQEVRKVWVDKAGAVWMGTQTGLYYYSNKRLLKIDYRNGLIGSEVNTMYADGDSLLYVGTPEGVSRIPMRYVSETLMNAGSGKVSVQEVWVNGELWPLHSRELNLRHNQNNLLIALPPAGFMQAQLISYSYSINGGTTWAEVHNRTISLQSLSPGSYQLLIKAWYRNVNARPQYASLAFSIGQPLYRNILFIILCSIALLALTIFGISRYYKAKRLRETEKLELRKQLLDLEQKAMAALLNPHFVFNAINSINYYINNKEEEKYTRLLTNLSQLIRKNLNNTYKNAVSLASELEVVALYVEFEKHRFIRHPLHFSVNYQYPLPAEQVKIPSMMIQPFVENAIWHGILPLEREGHVWINVKEQQEHYLQIEIEDDGAGISPAQPGDTELRQVRGIQLIMQRIEAYNQLHAYPILINIALRPGNQSGTIVSLSFPLGND
jgi:ligand-binding sensor domain-containing protein